MLGATVLDMGGGTTGMAVMSEGHVLHTAHDCDRRPCTSPPTSPRACPPRSCTRSGMKTLYGNARRSPDDEREMLTVPLVGEEDEPDGDQVPRAMVVNIIRPRLEETFELVRERLEGSGPGARRRQPSGPDRRRLPAGRRAPSLAAQMLGRQVRLGRPSGLRGLPDAASGPGFRHRGRAAGLGRGRRAHHPRHRLRRPSRRARRDAACGGLLAGGCLRCGWLSASLNVHNILIRR